VTPRSLRLRAFVLVVLAAVVPLVVAGVLHMFDLDDAAARMRLTHVLTAVVPGAAIVGIYLGWRLVRPVEKLRAQVERQLRDDVEGARITLDRHDELGDLARAFDGLVGKLRDKNRQNEAFVQDLVHEMKNPLAALRAATEALAGDRAALDERTARLVHVLDDGVGRLDHVVTDLLELARAESGLLHEERRVVDVGELAVGVVAALAEARRVRVRVQVSRALLRCVPERIESALRNLVDNALDFGTQVHVTVTLNDRTVVMDVHDDGAGIPADALPRVFERFFTTRGAKKGTGLGLALVRAIAEAHGGTVAVTSTAAAGTTFAMRLPR
jgi:two-component system sensor histidine kinase ChvG